MRNPFQKHKRGVLKALSKFAVESIEYGLTLEDTCYIIKSII